METIKGVTRSYDYVRTITGHETNAANRQLDILADEPSHGNASHYYAVSSTYGHESREPDAPASFMLNVHFQEGPIKDHGINGVTNEVLLAIVADRLRGFQAGPYSCRDNAIALTKVEEAMHWLLNRTRSREVRGVEGTSQV